MVCITGQSSHWPSQHPFSTLLFCRYHQLSHNRRPGLVFGSTRVTFIAPISTSSSNALHLYRKTITYSQTFFLPACSFSTPPTTTPESKDASSLHTIPPATLKPKVELRPGPIKPPIAPSSSQSPRTKKLPTTNPSFHSQLTSSTAKPSNIIVETMKEDLKQAYIHGVLTRPPPGAGKVATLWHQAKELFKFYFRGLKLVITHRRQAKEIQARVNAGGEPLSRWESRFIQTNKSDLARLVPFVAIVLVLEEVIPLIVLYAPGMLPSTCILASQRERIDAKRREKQRSYAETMPDAFLDVLKEHAHYSSLHSLLSLSTWGPDLRRRRRIQKYLGSVVVDDGLLAKEGMGDRLTHPELLEALWERGITTDGLNKTTLKARLRWWLTMADKIDEGTPVSRRTALVAQSALGQFQVRIFDSYTVCPSEDLALIVIQPVRIFAREDWVLGL
ncbi:hypothetical protein DFH94DRAFT_640706 [Russula ochroleuca]|uniref:Letm1 RBD domain-containing protein n=1 Tax=Russula ochroleuca TaxID=152965 RepID=A0A9P5MP71_9AGAM|nr:hypothetical protein DFH94DRAFT_640706 [Russula ochroleuca]